MAKDAVSTPTPARGSFMSNDEQLAAMERLARQHQRSLSGEIRMALDAWIERCAAEESPQS